MAIKLKTKIALGGTFLFALLIVVGAVSFFYLNKITSESKDIVKDNYETLNYSRDMLRALEELNIDSTKAYKVFDSSLQLQEKNITEPGEKEMTDSLRSNFNALRGKKSNEVYRLAIRRGISAIMQVNLQAIDRKNKAAKVSAEKAKTIIALMLAACLLIGFTFIFNFPSLVASPIASLTEAIKAIANKQYSQRVHLNRKDEFGDLANAFNSMAEKLDQYEHSTLSQIMFEKQRAETILNSLKDASIGIDMKGIVLFANQQALQLLSLKDHDILGQSKDVVQKKNDLFRFLLNEQGNMPFKIVVDGKENYFTKEIVDIDQQGKKVGYVIVLKNITSFKELDTAKTNFIATISHELKTPLASSDFSLKLLEDDRIGKDEQRELIQQLKSDNQRMLRILSELLDMSQLEAGKLHLDIQSVSPYQVIENSVMAIASSARERELKLIREIDVDLPNIKADPDKIGWVLNNFLTNAIKYSPSQNNISIESHKTGNQISFSVADKGQGIDEKYLKQIFDRYFQVPGRSDKKGSGIGLAICKEFIEAMGGTIWVKSKIGEGSVFGFDIPIG